MKEDAQNEGRPPEQNQGAAPDTAEQQPVPGSQEGAGTIALHNSSTGDNAAEESKGADDELAYNATVNQEFVVS